MEDNAHQAIAYYVIGAFIYGNSEEDVSFEFSWMSLHTCACSRETIFVDLPPINGIEC